MGRPRRAGDRFVRQNLRRIAVRLPGPHPASRVSGGLPVSTDHDAHEQELVMPFVTVTSKGGPHDDNSFVAGYRCGQIDAILPTLAQVGAEFQVMVTPAVVPQLDLIAMRHGYQAIPGEDVPESGEWVSLRFILAPAAGSA